MRASSIKISRTARIAAAVLFAAYAVLAVGCERPGQVGPPPVVAPVNPNPPSGEVPR